MTNTPTQRLAAELLDVPLADYIAELRAKDYSWHDISLRLRADTAGKVSVTGEAVRKWSTTRSAS